MDSITDDECIKRFLKFIIDFTSKCDDAHDISHILAVVSSTEKLTQEFSDNNKRLAWIAAHAHELTDSKQKHKLTEQQLKEKLSEFFSAEDVNVLTFVIQNVSFSKAKKRGFMIEEDVKQDVLDILYSVRDADAMDNVWRDGDEHIAIKRMMAYRPGMKGEELVKSMWEHYAEKLSVVHEYAKSDFAKSMIAKGQKILFDDLTRMSAALQC